MIKCEIRYYTNPFNSGNYREDKSRRVIFYETADNVSKFYHLHLLLGRTMVENSFSITFVDSECPSRHVEFIYYKNF